MKYVISYELDTKDVPTIVIMKQYNDGHYEIVKNIQNENGLYEINTKDDELESYKRHHSYLYNVFYSMIEASLGKDYYNMGADSYSCNEFSGYDMMFKINRKTAEKYKNILQEKMKDFWENN